MKGDFTRNTFNPLKHFTRVLMQQGRVQLDADWNEQTAILLHYLQTLAADLIGQHGGPDDGFKIIQRMDKNNKPVEYDFSIQAGHYYVRGLLCENEKATGYTEQDDYPLPDEEKIDSMKRIDDPKRLYLVYLDVWERHITYLEDGRIEDPNIREVALGVPDTATRARLVRQVKIHVMPQDLKLVTTEVAEDWIKKNLIVLSKAHLRARAKIEQPFTDPCTISPDARYRGAENQLYRVEVHRSGLAWDKDKKDATQKQAATFKWSRENGSVIFPISDLAGDVVTLKHLGRDSRFGLAVGDWVEIVDDDYVLQNRADPLLKVKAIDPLKMQVTLDGSPEKVKIKPGVDKHPLLRRWDHKRGDPRQGGLTISKDTEGAALIVEGEDETGWLMLEDGIQIQFQTPKSADQPNHYRTGDYWLIPARTATGDVEWPGPSDNPDPLEPHGVEHHFAPLAVITLGTNGEVNTPANSDLRRKFKSLVQLTTP